MQFGESISTCFNKYADFNGRATRSEYWWYVLFLFLVSAALSIVNRHGTLSGLFSLATLLPSLAVSTRRLHDTNRSGWWVVAAVSACAIGGLAGRIDICHPGERRKAKPF